MKIVSTLPNLLRRLAPPLLILAGAFGASTALYAVGAWVLETLGTPQEITKDGDIAFIGMPCDGSIFGATGDSAATVKIPPFAVPGHDGSGTAIMGNVRLDLPPGGSANNKTFGSAAGLSSDSWNADHLSVTSDGRKCVIEGWSTDTGRKGDGAAEVTSARRGASFASPLLMFPDNAGSRNDNRGKFSIGIGASGPSSKQIGPAGNALGGVPEQNALDIGPLLAVPEPGSAAFAVLGGLGFLSLRHRKSAAV